MENKNNQNSDLKIKESLKKEKLMFPIASMATGTDSVYVGRIRRDYSIKNGLNIWVVADNIRKGAASNAVQILEILLTNSINIGKIRNVRLI